MDREAKQHREMEPQPEDFLMLGLDLQNKCDRQGTWASAERNFREFFGASSVVVAVLWRMLSEYDLVTEGGEIVHILWTLHFFVHTPRKVVCVPQLVGQEVQLTPRHIASLYGHSFMPLPMQR